MPAIRLSPFGGMRPAISSSIRDVRYGDYALNAKLQDGSLRPLRAPALVATGDYKSITCYSASENGKKCGVQFNEDCRFSFMDNTTGCSGFDTAVHFFHRCEDKPHERENLLDCTSSLLCLNPPERALDVTVMDDGTREECDVRLYTYTWVDQFGSESAPAVPSNEVSLADDGCVRLAGFDDIPDGASCIRIYRTTSPFDDGENASTFDTTFQLVEEVPVSDFLGFYKDDKRLCDIAFGTLMTMSKCCPENFCGVVQTESGYYVGFADNKIWVSERNDPTNFPLANMMELPDRVVNIVAHRDTVLVGTTGSPYRVSIAAQENGDVIEAESYREQLPLVSPDSMVATPWGAMYATDIGLVGLFPNRAPVVLSKERITEDKWKQYIPDVGAWWRGRYYGFREKGDGIVFDVAEGGESRLEIGDFSLHNINAQYVKVCDDGNMYLILDGDVYHWEQGTSALEYVWRSKEFIQNPRAALNAINIMGNGTVRVRIWGDGCLVYECMLQANCRPCRLGRLPRATKWQIELRGTAEVDQIFLGSSIAEVSQAA